MNWNVFQHSQNDEPEAKSWFVYSVLDSNAQHLMPSGDTMDHDFSGDCSCGPTSMLADGSIFMYVHKAKDGRKAPNA